MNMMASATISGDEAVRVSVAGLLKLVVGNKKMRLRVGRIRALRSGQYVSSVKGRGMEFDESRPYQAGDDVRHLDWRVTARTGKTYSKLFRQEQERPVFLWVDQRAPMRFATRGKFKSVIAAQLASLLAWNAAEHGDRVGGIVFSDHAHHETRPKSGRSSALQLMRLLSVNSDAATSRDAVDGSGRALLHLRRLARPGSLIFLISDFRDIDEVLESRLLQLAKHSDLGFVLVYDPLEMDLPPAGYYQLSDGRQRLSIDTYSRSFVASYREHFIARRSRVQDLARLCRARFISCSTADDPCSVLYQQLNA
jgi:uncharacterized protein (DUF58 family)